MIYEKINNPNHYNGNGFSAIDLIEKYNLNFSIGSAAKYIIRAGKKPSEDTVDDLKKAVWYIKREINNKTSLNKILYRFLVNELLLNKSFIINIIEDVEKFDIEKRLKYCLEYLLQEGFASKKHHILKYIVIELELIIKELNCTQK